VRSKKTAAARDVKPRVRIDEQALAQGRVVAVQLADEAGQMRPAEILKSLHALVRPAKQVEATLENLPVPLRERARVRVRLTFALARDEEPAQLFIKRAAVGKFRKAERHREHLGDLHHSRLQLRHAHACTAIATLFEMESGESRAGAELHFLAVIIDDELIE